MGSATREALNRTRASVAATGGTATLATGEHVLAAGRVIGGSAQLLQALADPSAETSAKKAVVTAVFGSTVDAGALAILETIASQRWSSHDDVLAAIEELGIRILGASSPATVSVESELFEFGTAVSSNAQLELALGSKLGSKAAKIALVNSLLAGKASPQTVAIVTHLVSQPRGRRIGELLRVAARIVADEAGKAVATVSSATPISPEQLTRLSTKLAGLYGRSLTINQIIDTSLIGGLRIQVGDDVIDGSLSTRIQDLRLQLAG